MNELKYKIKLASGRVLGPLELERVKLLILKKHITGSELAREVHPGNSAGQKKDDWRPIQEIALISDLLLAQIAGKLTATPSPPAHQVAHSGNEAATVILSSSGQLPGSGSEAIAIDGSAPEGEAGEAGASPANGPFDESHDARDEPDEDEQKTVVHGGSDGEVTRQTEVTEMLGAARRADQGGASYLGQAENVVAAVVAEEQAVASENTRFSPAISSEPTVLLPPVPKEGEPDPKRGSQSQKLSFRSIVIGITIAAIAFDTFFPDFDSRKSHKSQNFRATLPALVEGKSDPQKSQAVYAEAMKYYVQDFVPGYKKAAALLLEAASLDVNNAKAFSMLASTYLNLIDSSERDDGYFNVVSKLIDLSRSKGVDVVETVIADVEYFLIINKAEVAQNRIIEYTKTHENYSTNAELFYFLALAYYSRGEFTLAVQYLNQIPDERVFSPRVFYLKGLVAEGLKDSDAAYKQYNKALQKFNKHSRSRLRISYLAYKQGKIKTVSAHVDSLVGNPEFLSPKDRALGFYLHGMLMESRTDYEAALLDMKAATELEPSQYDYWVEYYSLRGRTGEDRATARSMSKMFYHIAESEKLVREGRSQDAIASLLQAKEANPKSIIPLVKLGEVFTKLQDFDNSKKYFKKATDLDPTNTKALGKYIESLLTSFEWEEANRMLSQLKRLKQSESDVYKIEGDLNQARGLYVEALKYYQGAMRKSRVDPDVYFGYARTLMSMKNFKDAPFFLSLGLRFDPLNVEAIVLLAKCIAETESVDRAITSLQDQLKREANSRAEYLGAIAEFYIQKGEWESAQQLVNQAMAANPNYAYPWKLQAQIFANRENQDRDALKKALDAYQSFSERNTSDPTGYLERFKIYMKKMQFEKAKEELNRIYAIYPKFPKLRYYFGRMYAVEGNHKQALEEFRTEVKNNPDSVDGLIEYGRENMEFGQFQEALKSFVKAMSLAPQSSEAKQNAAWANYKLKHYQAAISLFQGAIQLDHANPNIYKRLGIVYRDMSDMTGACEAFKKYLEMEPDAPDKGDFAVCLQ